MTGLTEELTSALKSQGGSLVGFADLGEIDPEARDNFPYGVSIAVAVDPQVVSGIEVGPTAEYRAEYTRVNLLLDDMAVKAARFLADRGYRTKVRPATFEEDQSTLTAKLPHKTVATRAGLGWIGKCALLVTRPYGSAVRLVTVLTDAPVEPGAPVTESLCAHCTRCIEACPAHAHTGEEWRAGVRREQLYDPFACRAMARSLSEKLLRESISICGICITACPWTQKYLKNGRAA